MMKRILVIEREYGAGGSVIAEQTATRLGWKLLDHALTEEIARLAKVHPEICQSREERVDPWLYRLAKVFWRGSPERSVPLVDSDVLDAERLICLTRQVVEEAAAQGQCVIVGRGAAHFLRNRADTFCVFLYAPREVKYQRVLADVKNEAEALRARGHGGPGARPVREALFRRGLANAAVVPCHVEHRGLGG